MAGRGPRVLLSLPCRPLRGSFRGSAFTWPRELLKTSPAEPDWPEVKRELFRCAELRREMIAAGWFN
jgi:hypothetical protein